ncbi:hypothetical protein RLIN73S_06723 [Rhodanobacter lindaniclasticus]
MLQRALRVAAAAITRRHRLAGPRQRLAQQRLVQHAGGGQRFRQLVQRVDVAKHQPQGLGVAKAAQCGHAAGFVVGQRQRVDARAGIGAGTQAIQPLRREQLRLAAPGVEREIAGQQGAANAFGHTGIVVQRHAGGAATALQLAVAFIDQRAQRGGFGRVHRAIVPQCAHAAAPRKYTARPSARCASFRQARDLPFTRLLPRSLRPCSHFWRPP